MLYNSFLLLVLANSPLYFQILLRAAELMTRTGTVVTLEVAKQGAIYHGLATLLNQPSPMMQRGKQLKYICPYIKSTLKINIKIRHIQVPNM